MNLDKAKYQINMIFRQSSLKEWIESSYDTVYRSDLECLISDSSQKNYGEFISELYKIMKNSYRNEYFYKNTLLNKLLLGVHSVNTTTALTELPIAKSKADFVLINGKAVVYEIKTELDNLERLESQIIDYYKVFDHVVIVTYEENTVNVNKIISKMKYPVGLYVLRKNMKLGKVISPKKYEESLSFNEMYKVLRKKEYEELIIKFYGELPFTTDFEYYSKCKILLKKIDIDLFYKSFINVLKKRVKIEKTYLENIPYELKFLVYFSGLKEEKLKCLNRFLY